MTYVRVGMPRLASPNVKRAPLQFLGFEPPVRKSTDLDGACLEVNWHRGQAGQKQFWKEYLLRTFPTELC